MLANYLKAAIRNLIKTKLFSLVMILGLSVGMTSCLLILHYVSFETSYDRFHKAGERIYRLRYERTSAEGATVKFASCTPPAAAFLRQRYPEVEMVARLHNYRAVVSFGERKFTEERMYFADPGLTAILTFTFLKGDPGHGLREANTAFISQSTARKYFGDQDALGKTFSMDKKEDYQVKGVFADMPPNSHLKPEILLSMKNLETMYGEEIMSSWGHTTFYTYLRLKPGTDARAFENKLIRLVESEAGELQKAYKVVIRLKMQPLYDIHLTSHFMQEYEVNGDRTVVNFLFIIALFIIGMAWVNYINLSTARALTRAREVGLRKVVGASRRQLMVQFFCEIALINLAALLISFVLVKLFLPFFTGITATPTGYSIWQQGWFWAAVPLMLLAGIFLSGVYPVLVMSSYQPAAVLKGKPGGSRGIHLRKILVIFQFVMSLVMVTGTFTVYRQLDFMKTQDPGFDPDQVVVVKAPRVRDERFQQKFITFKEQLLKHASINRLSIVTEVPGRQIFWDNGGIYRQGESASKGKNYQIVGIDYDFVPLFGLELAAGRNFSREFPADKDALLLNETGARWMGFENPTAALGQQVDYWEKIYTIAGVLKDYHQQSPKAAFEPHIYRLMLFGRDIRGQFAVKINPAGTSETLQLIRQYYDEFFPGNPFEFFFLDEYYNRQYQEDERFGKVFAIFSFLALLITALGIFGLASFMVLQRTREIGIRKVLGAGLPRILVLIPKAFMGLMAISYLLALPVSFLGVRVWLNGFAQRMSVGVGLFVLPLLLVSLVTLLTIARHVMRAALVNPVESLRVE